MKNKTLLLAILAFMVSCQDSMHEFEVDTQAEKQTRSVEIVTGDYYWFGEEKIPVRRDEAKTFVLYSAENEEMVMTYLPKSKDGKSPVSNDFDYYGTDMTGNSAKDFLNCKWTEVDASCEELMGVPGILYSAPNYIGIAEVSIPLSNLVYVSLKSDSDVRLLKDLAAEYNVGIVGKYKGLPHLYIVSCTNESAGNALQIANIFHESGLFEWSQPSFISCKLHSNDPRYQDQWNLVNTGQLGGSVPGVDINYLNATGYIPSYSSIVVAVIDTGIKLDHQDLPLTSFSWDAYYNRSPSSLYPTSGNLGSEHGTNVAGIISAKTNNSKDIAGIAPCMKVMPFSINFQYGLQSAQLSSAIRRAVDQGADVINCCWGTSYYDASINAAIDYAIQYGRSGKGCVVVCSSGNDNQHSILYPACYSPEDGVISVGAIRPSGIRCNEPNTLPFGDNSWGSNYGLGLDLVAPGLDVPTTTFGNSTNVNFSGTSAAAPHVSAVAALMLSQNSNLTYKEVGYMLQKTANKNIGGYDFDHDYLGGSWNYEVGFGLVNMKAALDAAHASITSSNAVTLSGNTYLTTNTSNYAGTTLTVSPNYLGYTYFWSATFTGSCDRWYIWPSNDGHGSSADISIYLNPGQSGGTLRVSCKVYNGLTYIGTNYTFVNVSPNNY